MGIGDSPSKSDYLRWQSSHYTSRHVNWIRVRSPFRRRDATLHPLPPRHINPTIILSTWWVSSPRHINTSNQFNWRSNGRFPYILLLRRLLFYSKCRVTIQWGLNWTRIPMSFHWAWLGWISISLGIDFHSKASNWRRLSDCIHTGDKPSVDLLHCIKVTTAKLLHI